MFFKPKLPWDDDFSPLHNVKTVTRALGFAPSRDAWSKERSNIYGENLCLQLWRKPQINWDGKVLGCCFNLGGDFGGNAFERGLERAVGSEKLVCARRMLHGAVPPDPGIPCTTCSKYRHRREQGRWIGRRHVMVERLRQTRMVSDIRRTRFWRSTLRPALRVLKKWFL